MADQRSTDDAIAAVLAAAEHLELPVTVEYSRRPPPLPGATGEVDATIRDDADEPLAAFLPMDVDAPSVATATDAQAEAMATILNDAPLLAAELRDLLAAQRADTTGAGALARVLASPAGEAIVDPADRQRLLELVAAAGGREDAGAKDREPLTVGAALAITHVAEYRYGVNGTPVIWWQARADGYARRWREDKLDGPDWSLWVSMSPADDERARPCRLVPIAEADADPATRGPL